MERIHGTTTAYFARLKFISSPALSAVLLPSNHFGMFLICHDQSIATINEQRSAGSVSTIDGSHGNYIVFRGCILDCMSES